MCKGLQQPPLTPSLQSLDGCESCHLLCKDLGPQASYNLVACDGCDLWSGGRHNLQPDQDLQFLCRPECGSLVVEVLVSACASHHQVIHLLKTQHDGSWHASDILPTLQGEGDELYGVWDVYLHQAVHKLAPLVGGHAPVSTKNPSVTIIT